LLESLHIVKPGSRIERCREPVGSALKRRTRLVPLECRLLIRNKNRTPISADLPCPGNFLHERFCQEQLAVGAIEHIEKSVAVGLQQQLSRLTLPQRIHQGGRFGGIPIPYIVRRELKIPFELPGLSVQGYDRAR